MLQLWRLNMPVPPKIDELVARNRGVDVARLQRIRDLVKGKGGTDRRASFNILPPFGGRFPHHSAVNEERRSDER